jgi:hypothetical protein
VRLRVARVLFAAAGAAALLAIWAWLTGGFRVHVLGIPISARGEHRAAFIALLLAVSGLALHDAARRRVTAIVARPVFPPLPRLLRASVVVAAATVLLLALAYGSRAASGSDPYGYVSQADLWRRGDLRIHQPVAAAMPWPEAEWTFSPLGYKPSKNQTIVPTYAPGYPMLMALFTLVFGAQGAFYVAPLCGAALVLLTYGLGARLSGPVVGAIAALSIACSPTVMFMTLSVMSDIPVAAFWAAALLLALRQTTGSALASAVAAGIAIVIRPNLVLAAIVPFVLVAWPGPDRSATAAIRRAAAFAAACAPFGLFVGWLFNDLYGSPLRSGYGDTAALFGLEHVGPNLARYPAWLLETQSPLAFLFLASPFVALWRRGRPAPGRPFDDPRGGRAPVRGLFAAFIAVIVVSYLVYLPFDAWWYLRFLLPAFPFVFVLSADAVWLAAEVSPRWRNVAMALAALVMIGVGLGNSDKQDVLRVGHGEQKHIEVGHYLVQTLPTNAVVYSVQHSGSIRYYSGRLTLRFDYLDPTWLDRSIAHLQQAGHEVFFVLDDWEVPIVKERFAGERTAALLEETPKPLPCTYGTYLYRVSPRHGEPVVVRIPMIFGCE